MLNLDFVSRFTTHKQNHLKQTTIKNFKKILVGRQTTLAMDPQGTTMLFVLQSVIILIQRHPVVWIEAAKKDSKARKDLKSSDSKELAWCT